MNYDKLQCCIDQKLQDYAITHGESIIEVHILYDYFTYDLTSKFYREKSKKFRDPKEFKSQIMCKAYKMAVYHV